LHPQRGPGAKGLFQATTVLLLQAFDEVAKLVSLTMKKGPVVGENHGTSESIGEAHHPVKQKKLSNLEDFPHFPQKAI